MQILTRALFPTLIWTVLFDDRESFNSELLKRAYAFREANERGVTNTNVKGWQSPNRLQQMPQFDDICKRIDGICREIAASQGYVSGLEYALEAWVNINPPGASNAVHIHPNCHFSGVYYITAPPDSGKIYFRDPRTPGLMVRPPITRENDFTATEAAMQAEAGRMYIFPSWLEHGVQVNRSKDDRVGISFNVKARPPRQA